MDKPLKEVVKERMKELKIGIPELAELTGIPAPRIYKWYSKERPANPKETDSDTLKKWLGQSSNSSNQGQQSQPATNENKHTIESLARSLELSAEARLIDAESRKTEARNIERLITLLEDKINSASRFAAPGTSTTETLIREVDKKTSM